VSYFCLTLLLDWLRAPSKRGNSKAIGRGVVIFRSAALEAAILTGLFYVVTIYLLDRFVLKQNQRLALNKSKGSVHDKSDAGGIF
jgi:hypothetical protein